VRERLLGAPLRHLVGIDEARGEVELLLDVATFDARGVRRRHLIEARARRTLRDQLVEPRRHDQIRLEGLFERLERVGHVGRAMPHVGDAAQRLAIEHLVHAI
jgi:hypothetical protein